MVWVGKKKRQKCFRQNLHPVYNLLKFNTLLFQVCTLCMEKRKFSSKKANLWNICWNLQSETSFPFTVDVFPASEKDTILDPDLWSYLFPIIWSIKGRWHNLWDNGAIPWTVADTPLWVTWVKRGCVQWHCSRIFLLPLRICSAVTVWTWDGCQKGN